MSQDDTIPWDPSCAPQSRSTSQTSRPVVQIRGCPDLLQAEEFPPAPIPAPIPLWAEVSSASTVSPPPATDSTSTDHLRLLRDAVRWHSSTPPALFSSSVRRRSGSTSTASRRHRRSSDSSNHRPSSAVVPDSPPPDQAEGPETPSIPKDPPNALRGGCPPRFHCHQHYYW